MSFFNALWHVANFLAAPLFVALILVLVAKGLMWRALLARDTWRTLWWQSALGGLTGLIGGLAIWSVEGKLAVWGAMLAGHAVPLAYRLVTR
ncbi:hypothetical protein [Inhella gelatinilytica]|uniref:Uncharacterized protein n=1 Tax=Inhella gelatinilytica TaxID=2795030 RepID=A0A931IVS9_9BURK|nr:hypothetical protein [Inhella gelatinilytica]MBH9552476.1 hypothetical protein [Inhella gelatinilytica]